GEQLVALADLERLRRAGEEVLIERRGFTHVRLLAAEDRLGRRDPLPAAGRVRLRLGAGGQVVVEPDYFLRLRQLGRLRRRGFGVLDGRDLGLNLYLQFIRLGLEAGELRLLLGGRYGQHRRVLGRIAVQRAALQAVEVGEQLVKLFLRQGIILVVM